MALRQLCSDKQQRSCKAARLPPVWLGKPCRPRHCAASQPAAEPGPTPTLCRHPGKRRALHRAQHQGHHTDTSGRASGRHPQAAAGDEASGQQPASPPAWQGLQLLLSQQGCRQQTDSPALADNPALAQRRCGSARRAGSDLLPRCLLWVLQTLRFSSPRESAQTEEVMKN